jgi:hypothetical protein
MNKSLFYEVQVLLNYHDLSSITSFLKLSSLTLYLYRFENKTMMLIIFNISFCEIEMKLNM